MTAPRLTVPLVLEAPERVPDALGGYRLAWRALGVLHAQMRARSGAERSGAVGPSSVVAWRITVRGARDGDPRRPRPGQRFRMGGRVFQVEAVAEADPGGLWLDCAAREESLS